MEPDSTLKIQWYDVSKPREQIHGPFRVSTKTQLGSSHLHAGVIIVKCSYSAGSYHNQGYNCLRVDNVHPAQLEELAQNFLVLAEARYGQ